ncbi:hypothetical protein VTJ83DRAFT_4881 [Remersonia thermophila]|uniref:Uncharacterized protein n=1 Tax=Remersonia thermophila TaxID=72144 RepID=A0ABR4DC50_9PEZI
MDILRMAGLGVNKSFQNRRMPVCFLLPFSRVVTRSQFEEALDFRLPKSSTSHHISPFYRPGTRAFALVLVVNLVAAEPIPRAPRPSVLTVLGYRAGHPKLRKPLVFPRCFTNRRKPGPVPLCT